MKKTAVVVGAGVVGLACATALSRRGIQVYVLEAASSIGTGISSRNSEVIHAGVYYPKNSLKARLCVSGKEMLYKYCKANQITHKRCGKLIVATSESQLHYLEHIKKCAVKNGVHDLVKLSADQVKNVEPDLKTFGALLSPSTGIVDSHGLMMTLLGELESNGGVVVLNTRVDRIETTQSSDAALSQLRVGTSGIDASEIECNIAVNASGLFAPELAAQSIFKDTNHRLTSYFAKGNYFRLENTRNTFTHLIYPIPDKDNAGLGIHATLDLQNHVKFGPDVEWLDNISRASDIVPNTYTVDTRRVDQFYEAIRKYWPGLPDNSLQGDYAGIRHVFM